LPREIGEVAIPSSYCSETRQVAVSFDYKTPFSNRILTNGFSFYIRVSGTRPDSFDLESFCSQVRNAFQSGISLWTASLQDHDHLLTEPVRRFIETRSMKSQNGYWLLIPPQVIELRCPQSATFVVDLSFGNRSLFPRPPLVLAKAQTEGRTIALNVLDFRCFRAELLFDTDRQLTFELPDNCINLVPIMAHEIGHAFGIMHIDDPAEHALMDSRFSRDALMPTDCDVVALVAALHHSVTGSAPGVLTFVSSNGVQPPIDYHE
jgi:Matrixin